MDGTKEDEVMRTNDGETVLVTDKEKDRINDIIYNLKPYGKVDKAEDGKWDGSKNGKEEEGIVWSRDGNIKGTSDRWEDKNSKGSKEGISEG